MARQAIATLLTDFGTTDPYVAAMKGALLNVCPRAQIIDICHDIPAHDILSGSFVLAEAAPYFPPETVHIAVVDPGVGTERRVLVGRFADQIFLFPDNGIISFVAEAFPLQALVAVRNANFAPMEAISMTFHGRDVFAPLAGQILNGLDIRKLGPQPDTFKTLDLPVPVEQDDKIVGQVIYVDRFGNCISNITRQSVQKHWSINAPLEVRCGGREIGPLVGTYEFAPQGEKLALFNSMGLLEVAVNRGRACDILGASIGSAVEVVETSAAGK